uniref:HTH psq-type domain-containing protein n=1 Tax=Trichuris muris TaxID=70415 RepID=A0A5S6QQ55_TRIMR
MASWRPNEKNSTTSLSLEEKPDIIRFSESGMSNAEIGQRLGIVRQTVMSKEKCLNEVRSATPTNTKRIRQRSSRIADMEKILTVWIEENQNGRNIPLSQDMIQFKSLALFNTMKAKKLQKKRAVAAYPSELGNIIEEGGYMCQQIVNTDETGIYWKMPSRSFIAKEERSMPGFKISKGRLTLLLGANAAGDFKLKLIYRSENLRALKNYTKFTLPVLYRWQHG